MKKGIYAILAVLTVFAMVMTGCDNGGGGGKDPDTYTVTFDAKGGTPTPDPKTDLAPDSLITRPNPSPTRDGYEFDGWYKEGYTTRWNFNTDRVNGNITLYAKWKEDVGTSITTIKIDGIDFATLSGADLGYPGDSLTDPNLAEGSFEPGSQQPPQGASIEITAKTATANVTWVNKSTAPDDSEFGTDTPIKFEEGDKLYIKIVNGDNASYYVIRVYFVTSATIYYGQPVINGTTIDPLWDNYNGPDIQITRIATNEVTPNFKFLNTADGAKAHTLASAKAYWDDDGLYIYATVTYHDYYADQTAKDSNTPTERVTQMRGNYESDSLEIMTCLRYQLFKADPAKVDIANQYRVGFSDGDSSQAANTFPSKSVPTEKFVIGGNHRDMAAIGIALENLPRFAFQQSGEFYAWITKNGTKETGYKIICKVPWYLIGYTQTSDVFGADGLVKDNAQFGLEFQLNTSTTPAGTNPSRDGLLTWNSVTSQGVTNCSNYGIVTLARGSNPRVVNVHAPVIGTHPADTTFNPSSPGTVNNLTVGAYVGATVPEPALTYQWYKAADATAAGTEVGGATTATLKPSVSANETAYYYVVVTNTNNAATGTKTATVTSNRAKVYPKEPVANHVVSGGPWQITEAWTGQYNNGIVIDVRKNGQPVSRDDYGTFTIAVKFYSDAGLTTEVQPANLPNNAFQLKWFPTVVNNANGSGNYGDTYNWGKTSSAFTNAALPGTNQDIAAISLQTGGVAATDTVPFFKIESITFFPK